MSYVPYSLLIEVMFYRERDMDCMPGYELTELWLTEDGLPRKGLWDVTYYSGEGKGLKDCKPVVKFRKSLLQLVCFLQLNFLAFSQRFSPNIYNDFLAGFD
jgi:hypothetical protein